tara:strand:- start:1249 stop:1680 length:432 start_codon:yes stop_codon:yes gene_type:complete
MSKLGRYSAQRRKVESVTASKSLEVHDCGTIVMLNAAAGLTVTLPSVADAGNGWWVKVIIGTNCTSNSYIITEKTSADTNVLVSQFNELETDDTEDGPSSTGHTTITFGNAVDTVGDFVEIVCDGSKFYCHGQTVADGGAALA